MELDDFEMSYKNLLVEKKESIGWITFNRPQVLNALDAESRRELIDALDELEKDPEVRVVVLTGAGDRAFCAGADVRMFVDITPTQAKEYVQLAKAATRKIETLKKPVIAAVNGFAMGGGCEIALACDIVVAARNAKFGQTEINVGLIPGAGGTQRLPRIIGLRKAKELIFTGELLDANEALELGLVNRVVDFPDLVPAVQQIAQKLKEKSPLILRFAKECVNKSIESNLQTGLALESELFSFCFSTEDQKEGVTAFLEKRQPIFKGR